MAGQSIFISYRRGDTGGHARALYEQLRGHFGGDRVFFDRSTIESGDVFPDRLRQGVEGCAVLLALIGPEWLDVRGDDGRPRLDDPHDFVRREIALALKKGKRVIPVLFSDTPVPPRDKLPDPLKALADCDAVLLRGKTYEYEAQLQKLVELIPYDYPRDASSGILSHEHEPVVVELTIAKEFNDFTDEEEANLLRTLKDVLDTESLPTVLARIPGSTRILLKLLPEQAEQLLWLSRRGVLEAAGVTNAKLLGDSAAIALLEQKLNAKNYDVFLCYNSNDKDDVRKIGFTLRRNGILPWFDEWEQQPGTPWQVSLEEQVRYIKSAAVFVGNDGLGPWQDMELNAFIRQFVQRKCPVIPVFLKCCREKPALPPFLGGMTSVDFRKARPSPFLQLVWGITGVRPEASRLL